MLGTDGMPCLDTPDRITPLDDLRWLLEEGASLVDGLGMITTVAARALGLRAEALTFAGGCEAGLLALALPGTAGDSLAADVAQAEMTPSWVHPPKTEALEPGFRG